MGFLRLTRDGVIIASIPVTRQQAGGIVVPPGGNLAAAYSSVPAGGTIWLQTGQYGAWDTPTGSKLVTIQAQPGQVPKFTQIHNKASNITFDGLTLDALGQKSVGGAVFETGGMLNVTFRNGFIGNVHNEKGALAGGPDDANSLNTVFDNVRFDKITFDAGVHSEAIYSQAPGLVVKNCYFGPQCGATGAILITRGDWWGQPYYSGMTFLNNTFERQIADHGSIIFGNVSGPSVIKGAVIRNNVFLHPTAMPEVTGNFTFQQSVESGNSPTVNLPGITHE